MSQMKLVLKLFKNTWPCGQMKFWLYYVWDYQIEIIGFVTKCKILGFLLPNEITWFLLPNVKQILGLIPNE